MGTLNAFLKKKLKASSLTEVIVATSILLLVFAISLATLNNIMVSSVQQETNQLETKAQKLLYQYENNQLKIPLSYVEDDVTIQIRKIKKEAVDWIEVEIQNKNTTKSVTKTVISHETE